MQPVVERYLYVEGKKPSAMEESAREMREGLEALRQEIAALRGQLGQSS